VQRVKGESPAELSLKTAATLLASGIDPKKSCLFVQSHVPEHTELMWILSSMTPLSWLNRMVQFKEKKAKNDNKTSSSLYTYPILMASDILLYKATHVPVGEDQTQHLELARELSVRFNKIGLSNLFPSP
jgi:tryptophanyl-tRNA synthetase